MSSTTEQYMQLLEQRVSLLRRMARELLDCRPAFITMDLDGIYRHIAAQEDLCRRLYSLNVAICAAQEIRRSARAETPPRGEHSPEIEKRLRELVQESVDSRSEVRRLNSVHGALLRRARRTLLVLNNLAGNYAITYGPPQSQEARTVPGGKRG